MASDGNAVWILKSATASVTDSRRLRRRPRLDRQPWRQQRQQALTSRWQVHSGDSNFAGLDASASAIWRCSSSTSGIATSSWPFLHLLTLTPDRYTPSMPASMYG